MIMSLQHNGSAQLVRSLGLGYTIRGEPVPEISLNKVTKLYLIEANTKALRKSYMSASTVMMTSKLNWLGATAKPQLICLEIALS